MGIPFIFVTSNKFSLSSISIFHHFMIKCVCRLNSYDNGGYTSISNGVSRLFRSGNGPECPGSYQSYSASMHTEKNSVQTLLYKHCDFELNYAFSMFSM